LDSGAVGFDADDRGFTRIEGKDDKGKRIERKAARGKGSSGEKGKIGVKCLDPSLSAGSVVGLCEA
jgi:hypothetical protein